MLTAYTTMAESNKNRRMSLFTIVPIGSILTMFVTIGGGSTNQTISTLAAPIGIFGLLLVVGMFFIALGATRHDEEYQTVITALALSLALPVPQMPTSTARKVITFLFASSIGSMVCILTWFLVPGFGVILAIIAAIVAAIISFVVKG